MDIRNELGSKILFFDGAMGTMLQKSGLKLGENPELLCFSNEKIIIDIHKQYIEAGANVITTNTFGANELKLKNSSYSVEGVIKKAVQLAKEAKGNNDTYIALDIGPIGELMEPMGSLSFDEAYNIFKRQVVAGVYEGVDLILIETMTDLYEAKAAILSVKENSDLPVFCTMSFEADGRTFTGCTPESMAVALEALGVDALGVNCSLGPKEILPIVKTISEWTNSPLMIQPNAGLPNMSFGEITYDVTANEFQKELESFIEIGVNIVGGCCGTTPEFIRAISNKYKNTNVNKRDIIHKNVICTPWKVVEIDCVKVIGERINPTGKKAFKDALKNGDLGYVLKQGIEQVEAGADLLDVNVGLPEIDEAKWMKKVVKELQAIIEVPLQIDSTNIEAIENGLRYYNGKPILNSVNGEDKSLNSILPLVKKYGASVVGLTLNDSGIPETPLERLNVARKIINKASEYKINKEDVFIDTLVLPISADIDNCNCTLQSLELVKKELGVKTLLGVSNVSFGLPNRPLINKSFLTLAMSSGLDLPIINPNSNEMMDVIRSFKLLNGNDIGANKYIEFYSEQQEDNKNISNNKKEMNLFDLIVKGIKDDAVTTTVSLLEECDGLEIVNKYIIPALNKVGSDFEKGKIFLPQLIASAETVQGAFSIIKNKISSVSDAKFDKGSVILATVKGDIHDIGKNIVKVILESYGYRVVDLGKDVSKDTILEAVKEYDVLVVGLSALMTTTVKSMEDTITLLKEYNPNIKVLVGGAVLTKEYSEQIGADYYARDAMESVRIMSEIYK